MPHTEPPPRAGVLTALRAHTAASHQRLEDLVRIEERIGDADQYRRLLELFLGFYEPLEERLESLRGWEGIDLSARRKAPWLARDLAALGSSEQEIRSLPRCCRLPALETIEQGYGCAYVLEGSTLGGRHISAMLQATAVPEEARTFFHSYGDEVGLKWREFIAALEAFAEGRDQAATVETAGETFECMSAWIHERGWA